MTIALPSSSSKDASHSMMEDHSSEFSPVAAGGGNHHTSSLAQEETKIVRQFRWLLLGVLLLFAVITATLVYIVSRRVEDEEFQKEFWSNGNKVISAFSEDSQRKMQALFSLSSALTARALHSNATWPFVTLPNSAQELGPYLSLADAAALTIFPIVPRHLRAEWEAYAVQNQGWIQDDLESRQDTGGVGGVEMMIPNHNNSTTTTTATHTISPYIKNYVGVDTSPGVWLPWWQYAPVIPNRWFVNFNRLAWKGFPEQLETILQAKATLSETVTFEPGLDFQSTRDFTFFDELLGAGGGGRYNPGEPLSYIFYPILQDFEAQRDTSATNKVVAVLSATVYWKSYFQGILPDAVQGIVCVVRDSSGQAFTYQVNGRTAQFLGMDDLHDHQFDDMRLDAEYWITDRSSTASQSAAAADHLGPLEYTGLPVDDERISYHLEVYPSTLLRDDHYSHNPIYFALAIAAVFVVCALIFAVYNMLVERRQKLVFTSAVRSAAVVDSMFPSNVRDRLMAQTPGPPSGSGGLDQQGRNDNVWKNHGPADGTSELASNAKNNPPIADHFEGRCTADILKSEGRISGITPREDTVFAKGKGELQYWLSAIPGTSSSLALQGLETSVDDSPSAKGSEEDETEADAALGPQDAVRECVMTDHKEDQEKLEVAPPTVLPAQITASPTRQSETQDGVTSGTPPKQWW